MFKRTRIGLACGLATAALTGCATPYLTTNQMQNAVSGTTAEAIQKFEASAKPAARVAELTEARPSFRRTEQTSQARGDITLHAAATPFAPILSTLGQKAGYSVAYSDSVDVTRKVTVDYNNAVSEDAIRTTAFLAGYAAVIDKRNRTIMVSDVATYTFKLPAGVFSSLVAQYTVGGNPAATASTSGGSSGGGSAGGTSLKADFSIQGKEGYNSSALTKFLQDMAGKNSEVIVSDSGHVTVRGNAQSLKRVHDFMRGFARDAMTQVEIEASVVEVALTKEFQMGIQWGKVVNAANRSYGAVTGGANGGTLLDAVATRGTSGLTSAIASEAATNGLSLFRVGLNSAQLINALAEFTNVNIVSQPRLVSMNNIPATFFDGTQLPYLGSVQQTAATTTGGAPTVTGSVAFAIDGVSFSAIPSVVDSKTVQVTLIPVLSSVNGFETFLNNTLTAPRQGNKQTYMRVLAESGKTMILGGIRYNKESKTTGLPTMMSSNDTTKEVVILLRTNVIPAPDFDPVVSESL
jgi:MSHA biogenesis protein MshL